MCARPRIIDSAGAQPLTVGFPQFFPFFEGEDWLISGIQGDGIARPVWPNIPNGPTRRPHLDTRKVLEHGLTFIILVPLGPMATVAGLVDVARLEVAPGDGRSRRPIRVIPRRLGCPSLLLCDGQVLRHHHQRFRTDHLRIRMLAVPFHHLR